MSGRSEDHPACSGCAVVIGERFSVSSAGCTPSTSWTSGDRERRSGFSIGSDITASSQTVSGRSKSAMLTDASDHHDVVKAPTTDALGYKQERRRVLGLGTRRRPLTSNV
jgi:hypothetical protein